MLERPRNYIGGRGDKGATHLDRKVNRSKCHHDYDHTEADFLVAGTSRDARRSILIGEHALQCKWNHESLTLPLQ